jgi:putative membrane protein
MDHFCANIIRSELAAITASPAPDLASWAFAPANDRVFAAFARAPAVAPGNASIAASVPGPHDDVPTSPDEWVRRGSERMRRALVAA